MSEPSCSDSATLFLSGTGVSDPSPRSDSLDPQSSPERLPKLSIIIVSFNTCELLRQCLHSLRAQCHFAEVIVVDNNSHDGSPAMVQAEFPEVAIVRLKENVGFAAANNVGICRSTGEILLLLNSDTVLEDESLLRCLEHMQRRPDLGAVSPRLIDRDGLPQNCCHRYPSLADMFRQALRWPPRSADTIPQDDFWIAGTCLMVRRDALESLDDQLDENFFMYWEDADLCHRLQTAGWHLEVFDDASIRHYGGASGGGDDNCRRPDLHAWYQYGRHHWFRKHRPRWHGRCIWLLELIDIPRVFIRGTLRPEHRMKRAHAATMFSVLTRQVVGQSPARPTGSNDLRSSDPLASVPANPEQ